MSNYIIPINEIMPEFCKVRNTNVSFFGNNVETATPRFNFVKKLLTDLNIPFEVDMWMFEPTGGYANMLENPVPLFNIYLRGTSNKMVMAHHDVMNYKIDNCNDNTASIVNAIACKILNPEVTVAITDGEEIGGHGSRRVAHKINNGYFGEIEFVANLELTCCGGKNFFTEPYPNSALYKKIMYLFPDTPTMRVPFHDGMILREFGIDSLVLNPLPLDENGKLKTSMLMYCHSPMDTIELANYDEMDIFVRTILTPLIR